MDKILDNLEFIMTIGFYVLCGLCLYVGMGLHDSYYITLALFDYIIAHNIENKLTK